MNEVIDTPDSDKQNASMFDGGLSTYQTVSEKEYESLLKHGLVVLDTSCLLDLYRYHDNTRKEFLRVFSALGDCLWIPHHTMAEFLERRLDVLEERSNYASFTMQDLRSVVKRYVERVSEWSNRTGFGSNLTDEAADMMGLASRQIEEKLLAASADKSLEGAEDIALDPIIIALEPILRGKVGKRLPFSETMRAKEEARARIQNKRPPGYIDSNKKGGNIEGDYLIWHEILREAGRRDVDVLFVTRDVKKDWWRIEKGQAKGPHQELVAELEAQTGTRLYMLRPASLLKHASDLLLPTKVSEESVQDAKRVSGRAFVSHRHRGFPAGLKEAALEVFLKLKVLDRTEPESVISARLKPPIDVILAAPADGADSQLLEYAWKVMEASSVITAKDLPTPPEEEILGSVWTLLEVAIDVWLDDKADEYASNPPADPRLFDFGPLPPYAVIPNVHMVTHGAKGALYEFSVALTNGNIHKTTRMVPPEHST